MRTTCVVLLSAGFALTTAGAASAGYPYAWPNELGPTAYGVTGTMYGLGLVPTPPYFALHPPVYYSCPVPRSYGYSPFAYPSCVQTPDVEFMNFPEGEQEAPAENDGEELPPAKPTSKIAARGRWIKNPFLADPAFGMIANPFLTPEAGPAPVVLSSKSSEVER